MRRRKCLSHADANAGDASAAAAVAAGELLLPSGAAAALSTAGGSGISGSDGANDAGDADGAGYGKSLCAGKDIQTAECRGEQCQIGKDGKCVYDRVRARERDSKTERQTDGKTRRQTGSQPSQQQSRQLDNNNNHSGHKADTNQS